MALLMKRRFNGSQKALLYILADGRCSECGVSLDVSWHADHIAPWSKGGSTSLTNGQALCPSCNLKKGNKAMLPVWGKELRKWQQEAFDKYLQHTDVDFLLEATPGAGKTSFSLRLAHYLLHTQQVTQVIIVCPTDHLKRQWARESSQVGIELDPSHSIANGFIKKGYHGITTTYQQIAFMPEIFRHIVNRNPTAVFFDEIHHAADSRPWGDALQHAFKNAHRRIGLSGTPFRGDNNPIPFIKYTDLGISQANHRYSYSDSLRDDVCRYVFFPKYEGRMEWLSGTDGKIREASFSDEMTEREASERLNTAIGITGDWINQVLKDANERLTDLRNNGHRDAGGLVIAKDQSHAQAIAELLKKITGQSPVIATSDIPDASDKIEQFRNSSQLWIVAVKMVSEGVDIPRLRILVYATNIATELFFRQAVGRIIRTIPALEEQNAFFFIPNDQTLVNYAYAIQEQRDHLIQEQEPIDPEFPDEYEDRGQRIRIPSLFTPIDSEAQANGAIFNTSDMSQNELDYAKQTGKELGLNLSPEVIAQILRKVKSHETNNPHQDFNSETQKSNEKTPLYERTMKLRKRVSLLVSRYAAISMKDYKDIHTDWLRQGGQKQSEATLEDLQRKQRWLEELINGK